MTSKRDNREIIRHLEYFQTLDEHLLDELIQSLHPIHFEDKHMIWKEGDPNDWGFLIVSGEVEVHKKAENESLIAVDLLHSGQWGGMTNLMTSPKRNYRFICRGEVEVLKIYRDDFSRLIGRDASIAIAFLSMMSDRLIDNTSRLADTIQYLTEILGFASHELQSPIASMVTDAQLLNRDYLGSLNEKQHEKLDRFIGKGKYLLTLIQKYLNLARLEDVSLHLNITPDVHLLKDVVEPMIDLIDSERISKNMKFDFFCVETEVPVECDVVLLRIAFTNLLKNAIYYGNEGGRIRVSVKLEDHTASLSVWNEGSGFSKEESSRLFKKFSRLDNPSHHLKPGTGIGLYSTWKIMQLHSGHIEADSEKGKWAEFKLVFPLKQPEKPDTDSE